MSEKVKTELIEWIKSLGVALIIGLVVITFARPSLVKGQSMLPNFKDNDVILVEKVSYFLDKPKRNDVVVCKTNMKFYLFVKKNIIKRVIGLPGDKILIEDGKVYINGKEADQSYTLDKVTDRNFSGVVPEKHIFVLGDNRLGSNDSRSDEIGFIPYNNIKGKVYFRLWPFSNFGKIS